MKVRDPNEEDAARDINRLLIEFGLVSDFGYQSMPYPLVVNPAIDLPLPPMNERCGSWWIIDELVLQIRRLSSTWLPEVLEEKKPNETEKEQRNRVRKEKARREEEKAIYQESLNDWLLSVFIFKKSFFSIPEFRGTARLLSQPKKLRRQSCDISEVEDGPASKDDSPIETLVAIEAEDLLNDKLDQLERDLRSQGRNLLADLLQIVRQEGREYGWKGRVAKRLGIPAPTFSGLYRLLEDLLCVTLGITLDEELDPVPAVNEEAEDPEKKDDRDPVDENTPSTGQQPEQSITKKVHRDRIDENSYELRNRSRNVHNPGNTRAKMGPRLVPFRDWLNEDTRRRLVYQLLMAGCRREYVAKMLVESAAKHESAGNGLSQYYAIIDEIHHKYKQVLSKKA